MLANIMKAKVRPKVPNHCRVGILLLCVPLPIFAFSALKSDSLLVVTSAALRYIESSHWN
jgi:hypothetical protein